MLEFFRRHRGAFLITITVIIIISFSVWGGWKSGRDGIGRQPTDTAFTIYGRDYTIAEAQRLGRRIQVIYMLQLFDLLSGLSRAASTGTDSGSDTILNQIVLEHEMKRLGIYPDDAEARAALEKLPAFMENGTFSQQRAYQTELMLGASGFNGKDMLEVMKLNIGFAKLRDLIGANYVASPLEAGKAYASEYQTLKVRTLEFKLEDFKKDVKVTDEEVKKYYEENKENYQTEEKREVSYVFFENPKDSGDKKLPDAERQKLERAVVERVNAFNDASAQPGAKFDELAKTLKEKVIKVGPFARSEPPEAFKGEPELIQTIFAQNPEVRSISDPIKGSGGYYLFSVTKVEKPKQQELVAVTAKVKEALAEQKAEEALSKAANDARTALTDGLKAGKKLDELAKEKSWKLSVLAEITVAEPERELPNAYVIARQAQDAAVGEVTKPVDVDGGLLLVYVQAKELRKRENSAQIRDNLANARAEMERNRLFNAWFTQRRAESRARVLIGGDEA